MSLSSVLNFVGRVFIPGVLCTAAYTEDPLLGGKWAAGVGIVGLVHTAAWLVPAQKAANLWHYISPESRFPVATFKDKMVNGVCAAAASYCAIGGIATAALIGAVAYISTDIYNAITSSPTPTPTPSPFTGSMETNSPEFSRSTPSSEDNHEIFNRRLRAPITCKEAPGCQFYTIAEAYEYFALKMGRNFDKLPSILQQLTQRALQINPELREEATAAPF